MLMRHPVSRRWLALLPAAVLFLGSVAAGADLDPEIDTPYRLKVVLDVGSNRLLTPLFLDQVERDLRDILQTELGALARVEVARTHPLLKEVRSKGLDLALKNYRRLSEDKTHFVRIDFTGGRYEIQARQHDGLTGLSSPLVRRAATDDRLLVARTAALVVKQDFGLVGTVTRVSGSKVTVALKGGELGVRLTDWVEPTEVFAVAQIARGSRGRRSVPMEWALLQVTSAPQNGVCSCQFYHRFKRDTLADQGGVLGYRCLKLGTLRGAPLRMRFLDFKTHAPLDSLQVHVSSTGFDAAAKKLATNREGLISRTEDTYSHVAFVRVLSAGKVRASIPVAMLSNRTVDCLISISAQAEEEGEKELRRDRWVRRIFDSLRVAADRVTRLNELGKKNQVREAFVEAKEGLDNLNADLKSLKEERDRLRQEGGLDLREGEQGLEELQKRQKELSPFVVKLGKIVKDVKDPRQLKMLNMIEQARLLETQAEFGQALKLYDEILEANPKEAKIRKRYVALERAWEIKNKPHKEARAYIYETWPTLSDPVALKKGLEKVRDAFTICARYHDALSPQKILQANLKHTDTLKKRFDTLQPKTREDDRKVAEVIAKVAAELKELHQEVTAYLKKEKPAFPGP
jgi:hypothetical protein